MNNEKSTYSGEESESIVTSSLVGTETKSSQSQTKQSLIIDAHLKANMVTLLTQTIMIIICLSKASIGCHLCHN